MKSCPGLPSAFFVIVFSLLVFLSGTGKALANTPDLWDGNWHYNLTPYAWLPGISANTTYQLPSGEGKVQNTSSNSIFSYLSGAFMLEGVARKDQWGIYSDVDWADFNNEKGRFTTIGGARIGQSLALDTNWEIKGGMFNLSGLYSAAHGGNGYVDVLFGVRYLWLKGNVGWDFNLTGNAGRVNIANSGDLSGQTHLTDAIVGVRGDWKPFHDSNFYFPYYLDVGVGGSNTTYQAKLGLAYAFHWGAIGLMYRDVQYHQDGDNNFIRKVQLSGPALSLSFWF